MFCTGTFPDCWRFIEVLTSSFAQVFVEAGNLRFNRQPPTPKMHYPSCNSSWFSWFLYVFVMNTLHLSSVFPSFLYLGPWGCPQVPSPSMWVRMALFGARRSRTWQWESSGKVNLNTWCFFMFFPNLDPVDPVDPVDSSIFPSLCGWHDGFFQHFPKFSGEIPGCSPHFSGDLPGPARRPRRVRAAAPCTWRRRTTASAQRGSARWRCCWAHAPIRRHGGHGWEVIEVPLYPIITINGIVVNGE